MKRASIAGEHECYKVYNPFALQLITYFVCSKLCQKNQWREREHKKYCRKDGQFEPGDLVQCARLKNKQELNGYIVRVIGRDTSTTDERYKVQMEGAVEGDKVFSLKPWNLNQLRPYDCRI